MSMYSILPKFAEEVVTRCGMEKIEDFKITINEAVIADDWIETLGETVDELVMDFEEGVIKADDKEYEMILSLKLKEKEQCH